MDNKVVAANDNETDIEAQPPQYESSGAVVMWFLGAER